MIRKTTGPGVNFWRRCRRRQWRKKCGDLTLDVCPTPYDQTLPAAKDMLTRDQASRVVGFRNDYRNYAGDVFRHGASVPLERAEKAADRCPLYAQRPHPEFAGLPEARKRQRYAGAERR